MPANDLIINGIDLDGAGFTLTHPLDRRRFPARQWRTARTALRAPHRLIANDPAYGTRELRMTGLVSSSTPAQLETDLDTFKSRLDSNDEVTIRFASDSTGRQFYGRLMEVVEGDRTFQEGPGAKNPTQRVVLRYHLIDMFAYETTTSTVSSIGATGKDIPLGTGPSWRDVEMTLRGPTTGTVAITYKNSTGSDVKRLKLSVSLASTSVARVINMENGTIQSTGSTSALSERVTGTDFPWALDPRDGTFASSAWPSVTVGTSTGGTNGTLSVTYRKAYV